ncbi:MAG: nitroreductase family deazaflavin-dependent oxidoreductase [Solirubrobacteraceae bacterium]|nr:nitroreductase family deazaflavin-dependent oxidoreductase [Solirubrobacteraceae bacterium]
MPLTGTYEPSASEWAREQAETYEATNGAEQGEHRGVPVVVVTSVGAKSGNLRKHPVMRVEHDGEYAVIASKGGADQHPAWFNNLVAHPHVELQDRAERHDYIATIVEGDDRATWWERAVAVWPDYADYQAKTDREIPVFVLTRTD